MGIHYSYTLMHLPAHYKAIACISIMPAVYYRKQISEWIRSSQYSSTVMWIVLFGAIALTPKPIRYCRTCIKFKYYYPSYKGLTFPWLSILSTSAMLLSTHFKREGELNVNHLALPAISCIALAEMKNMAHGYTHGSPPNINGYDASACADVQGHNSFITIGVVLAVNVLYFGSHWNHGRARRAPPQYENSETFTIPTACPL